MKPHDAVVKKLQEAIRPLNGEIRLLGRVADPIIGNSSSKEIFFFIPDLHLVSRERQERFGRYGFNHDKSKVLLRILEKLHALRKRWDAGVKNKLVTVTLGDFYDLWREFPGAAHPEEVDDDEFGELRDLLYRGSLRNKPCLKSTMLLGNHDTKRGIPLQEIPYQLKAFNRSSQGKPFLFTTHGDAFDQLEALPDAFQEFVVYFIGKLTPINKYTISGWGQTAGRNNKPLSQMNHAINDGKYSLEPLDGAVKVQPEKPLPKIMARVAAQPGSMKHDHFNNYYKAVKSAARQYPSAEKLRVVVVGHSHHARMELCRPMDGGRPLLLIDVGAWIENCEYPLAEGGWADDEPNAQLAVIHGNDARLYQISIPAAS
ncbi:MAG: metallophosphoesterase [Planctomycetota bacterium]|jgi:UDP-2,3-diacylglucosamine pyrophosphatase LpxH